MHILFIPCLSLVCTGLCAAAASGQHLCSEILLKRGAKITVTNLHETLPLHLAVSSGNWQVTELLLKTEGGAICIDQTDAKGCTAVMMAAKEGHAGLVELLLNYRGAGNPQEKVLEATDKQGIHALQLI